MSIICKYITEQGTDNHIKSIKYHTSLQFTFLNLWKYLRGSNVYFWIKKKQWQWKRRSKETQTLHTGCSKAEPNIFTLLQTPFPGVRDGLNVISWRGSLPSLKTQFGDDWCTQFRVIMVTDPQTHTHTNPKTGSITIHCAAASLTCSVITLTLLVFTSYDFCNVTYISCRC